MPELAVPEEVAEAEIVDETPGYPHPVIITWPAHLPGGYILPGWGVSITDALTGDPVTTVTSMDVVIHAEPDRIITADLVMFADEDGDPVPDGKPHLRDGEIITGTFRAVVARMREQETAPQAQASR